MNDKESIKIISKGCAEIVGLPELENKLRKSAQTKKPLIIKLGLDPTAPDIHLGHTVVLRKLKAFQQLGHQVVIIIGDFTAKIGDPTGRSEKRRQLSDEEVKINAATYCAQIFRVLDKDKTKVVFNSEWLSKLNFADILQLAATVTVAQMLEREDFKNRFNGGLPVFLHEFFYPIMQAFDSVELAADVEIGGTDQRFNILAGRALQKDLGREIQSAIFMPILEGTDGKIKMSKSVGNCIGINDSPTEMFGKTMSLPDELIIRYFELITDLHPDEIALMQQQLTDNSVNPRDLKIRLAKEIVTLYHNAEVANQAESDFIQQFSLKELPENIPEFKIGAELTGKLLRVTALLQLTSLVESSSEARRLIAQGAVKINREKIGDPVQEIVPETGMIIQAGKRKFVKLIE